MQKTDYDVAIVGAGLVGLSLAVALTRWHLRIAVLEAQPFEKLLASQLLRFSALNRASEKWFTELNIWPMLPVAAKPAYHKVYVWDAASQADITFDCHELSEPNLGYIVNHHALLNVLLDTLHRSYSVSLLPNTQLDNLSIHNEFVQLKLNTTQTITTRLLVGADGKHSKVRQLVQIPIKEKDYGHQALIATVQTEFAHQRTASQVFLPTGPLALLPLADSQQCSIVWSADPMTIAELTALPEAEFATRITQATEQRFGSIHLASKRIHFPLVRRHAKQYVQSNIALIGDAIHTIHPLAGQGLNLGLADAHCLSQVIQQALANHRPFYTLTTLRRYARQRKEDHLTMLAAMDGFKNLFSNPHPLLTTLRGYGLRLTDSCSVIKKKLVRHALGIR